MIIFTGAPGSGKSVQAELLEKQGIARWFSTGKLLREKLDGEQKAILERGDLVDDDITTGILAEELGKVDDNESVILDGFPRRNAQVEWLFTDKNPRKVNGAIYIDIPEEEAIARLRLRGREDDEDEVVKHRYDIFHKENQQILDHLERQGVSIEKVDGVGTPEEVHERVQAAVNRLSRHR